ncbi:MAG: hypothetical protein U1F44_08255 [Coriobacteriia bacterium]|nr:hypothetical protein [Coriobacteriia bacterium]
MVKRLAVVLALTCAFTMMFAGVALATWADGTGYASWSTTTTPANATTPTPHAGYTTATVKCAVCHAVHGRSGATAGEALLRGTVGGACEYCHIAANVSNVKVYGGNALNYTGDFNNNHMDGTSSKCVNCHAVHSANSISTTGAGDINTKILLGNIGGQYATVIGANATWNFATGSVRDGVVTAFCAQCHQYWAGGYDDDATANMHIMGAAAANYANTKATTTVKVAWAPSTYCRSCHDAGVTDGASAANNFPHYTAGARFLLSAADFTAFSAGTTAAAGDPSQDGACLKCHRNNSTNTGVGFGY